jgi:hypothetical protein
MLALGNNADGRLEVVATSNEQQPKMWHCWEQPEPGDGDFVRFSNWVGFGGPPPRQVAMARNQDGCLEVFAVGWDKIIYHARQTGPNNGWSAWTALAHPANQIAVGRNQDGRLEIYALNDTPSLCHVCQEVPNRWGQPTPPLRHLELTPLIPAPGCRIITTANSQDGKLRLFALAKTGEIVELIPTRRPIPRVEGEPPRREPNKFAWRTLAQNGSNFAVGANEDGRLEIFWGAQGVVMHQWQTSVNGTWGEPACLGAQTSHLGPKAPGQVTAAQDKDGQLHLFALDQVNNGTVFQIFQTTPNGDWGSWQECGLASRWFILAGRAQNRTAQLFSIIGGAQPGRADCWQGAIQGLLPDRLVIVSTPNLPPAWVDEAYSALLQASGGAGTYAWSLAADALPAGLNLNSAGQTSGIPIAPTAAGPVSFTVRCVDQSGQQAEQPFSLLVNAGRAPLITSPSSLPSATVDKSYSISLQAQGGKTPYRWLVKNGTTLPEGLVLDPLTGAISGIPSTAGPANLIIQCRGANALVSEKSFSLMIESPIVTPPGTLQGSFAFKVVGTQPSNLTLVVRGELVSGSATGTQGKIHFEESFARTIAPASPASIDFKVLGLMPGRWRVTAVVSGVTAPVGCEFRVPGTVRMSVIEGESLCGQWGG